MMKNNRNQGSYRDPYGAVYEVSGKVFRGVDYNKKKEVLDFLESKFYKENAGFNIVGTKEVNENHLLNNGLDIDTIKSYSLWLEHDAIDFITYPYEWSFELLKSAAIFHLDLYIEALNSGYQIKDASAYNVQYVGCKPIFIDTLSFEPYVDGARWIGYKQFCEQFLAPLVINSYAKINHNSWFRGAVEGVDLISASRVLPARTYCNPTILGNIHIQAWAMSRIASTSPTHKKPDSSRDNKKIPKYNLISLLESLRRFISKLKPHSNTYWNHYATDNSYSDETTCQKVEVVENFIESKKIMNMLDCGCNTGHFSRVALEAGAKRVIGLDVDDGAIDQAVKNLTIYDKQFTPLLMDLVNPSPSLGWNLAERKTLFERLPRIDGVLCLALIHHLVIGKNIPMKEFVDFVLSIAPYGIIEFVPKEDPMVQGLLAHRADIFDEYNEERFKQYLETNTRKIKTVPLNYSHRKLYIYEI